jgi:diguanylate cyclase (GGDEF)-like protein
LKITVSLGISQYIDKDNTNTIFKRADNALYKAKGNGRNRSEVE